MLRVFFADDSDKMRERFASLINAVEGVKLVGQAKDVRQAVKGIRRLKPDVAILDIQMPGGSGMNVLEKIRMMDPIPRVIILTAFPTNQHRSRYIQAGADAFFDKSTEFNRVSEVLEKMRDSRTLQEATLL